MASNPALPLPPNGAIEEPQLAHPDAGTVAPEQGVLEQETAGSPWILPGTGGSAARPSVRAHRRHLAQLRTKHATLYPKRQWAPLQLLLLAFAVGLAALAGLGGIGAITAWAYISNGVPDASFAVTRPVYQSVLFYDRNGKLLYELFDPNQGRRTLVHIEEVPPLLIDATLSAEDPTFFDNPGVDPLSMLRAAVQDYVSHGVVSGASTITQQLARNLIFTPQERQRDTLDRKLKEALFAIRLTQAYPKDQILEMYLNQVYYGNLSYGVVAAARSYFGKRIEDLTLPEAAMLAGLPQSPTDYNPTLHLAEAKRRQAYVLDRMVVNGYITQQEADQAKAAPLHFARQGFPKQAPHFVDYVINQLERRYGHETLYTSGWTVKTTVDLGLQQIAERDAKQRLAEVGQQVGAHNAAVVAIDPRTGEILTMLGSIDYWDNSIHGQVNVVTSPRQPGSTVKPFNYGTAFSEGYVPNTQVADVKTCFDVAPGLPPYCPQNFDFAFHGLLRLKEAFASSLNIPAVKVLRVVGDAAMADTAHRLGVTTFRNPYRYGLTLTLGTNTTTLLDMAYAYATLDNNGRMVGAPVPLPQRTLGLRALEPAAILQITDPSGKVVYRYEPQAKQVFSPQAAWLVTTSISDDQNRRFGYSLPSPMAIGRPAAAKTGTSNAEQDTWTIGYTPNLVAGVWFGNTDGTPMNAAFSGTTAAFIWHGFMIDASKYLNLLPEEFTPPPGVAYGEVCGAPGWYVQGQTPICYVP